MESCKYYPLATQEMADKLFAIASEASGYAVESIKNGGRTRPYPFLRYLVAYAFMNMSISSVAAGELTNLDHATVLHGRDYIKSVKEGYGSPYEKEVATKFFMMVDNINSREQIIEAEKCISLLNECRTHLDNARFRMGTIDGNFKRKLDIMYRNVCAALDQVY